MVEGPVDEFYGAHNILAVCLGKVRGRHIDDMVWFNAGCGEFMRVKGARRVIEREGRA